MNEIWKKINGFENYYEVSNFGNVRSLTNKSRYSRFNRIKILKPGIDSCGYLRVIFCIDGSKKQFLVHRLVLSTFDKDQPNLFVNHINGIKSDNRLENLEWCTQSENQKHAYRIGLQTPVDNGFKKSVSTVKDGIVISTYKSIREMCRLENLDRRAVLRVIDGTFSNHKGFTFKINSNATN